MVLTGRAGILAAAGVVFVALVMPSWAGIGVVVAAVLVVCLVDILLAGSPRRLQFEREGDNAVRLGEPAAVNLLITNPGRRVRGLLRDAWPPSAGVLDPPHKLDLPSGERRRLTTHLVPTRRGDRKAYRVTVRSVGPLGFAGRQGSHQVPWTVRALPPFKSRKHLPSRLARLRELDGRTALLVRGQGTARESARPATQVDVGWHRSGYLVGGQPQLPSSCKQSGEQVTVCTKQGSKQPPSASGLQCSEQPPSAVQAQPFCPRR